MPSSNNLVPRPGKEQYATAICSMLPITPSGLGGLIGGAGRSALIGNDANKYCHTPKRRNLAQS